MIAPALARYPVLFRWSVADGLNGQKLIGRAFSSEIEGVLSRTSTKYVTDRNGLLIPLPQGLPPLAWIGGEPVMLLEPARTNLCIRSEEFDTWASDGTVTVTANAITAPDGTTTADLLVGGGATSNARWRAITFTGDGEKCFAAYVKAGTAASCGLGLVDATTASTVHRITVTFGPTPTAVSSAGSGTVYPVESLGNGWYRILFSAAGVVAANTNRFYFYPDRTAGTNGTYFWGAQAENAVVPSSYIKTEASTVTRNADSLYFPFTAAPQAMTVYVRGREMGTQALHASSARYVQFSSDANADPRLALFTPSATSVRSYHDTGASDVTSTVTDAAVLGDLRELRSVLRTDGATVVAATRNGGTEVAGGASGALALAASWSAARLYLNSAGSGFHGQFAFTHVVVAAGEQSLATMRELAGV